MNIVLGTLRRFVFPSIRHPSPSLTCSSNVAGASLNTSSPFLSIGSFCRPGISLLNFWVYPVFMTTLNTKVYNHSQSYLHRVRMEELGQYSFERTRSLCEDRPPLWCPSSQLLSDTSCTVWRSSSLLSA